MAAFLQFLRFFNWKTDGKWKMENALVRKLLGGVRQMALPGNRLIQRFSRVG